MSRFFKGAALFALIACGVWIAVLWRWQATTRDISTRDIVMYLGLLPLTLFIFALMLRWAWAGVSEKAVQADAADAAKASAGVPSSAAAHAEDAARHATVQLLAAHIVGAAGASASDLQSAAKDGEPRPALDAVLRDEEGLPIMTARIADLDLAAVEAQLPPLLAATQAKRAEWAELVPGEHIIRALAALASAVAAAVESLLAWPAQFATDPGSSSATGASIAATDADTDTERARERRVRVLLGWPVDWSGFEQELGRAFVADWLAERGGDVIPAARFAITVHAGTGEDLLIHADRLLQTLAREGRDDPLIVAAAHSAIGANAIEAMERAGTLFGSKRPKARVPGEAAAALLVAGADWPASPDADGPLPHLHRPVLLRRDKSVDAGGRINGKLVGEAILHALATARITAEGLAGLVCDADQHTARSAEFYGASVEHLPELDSTEDLRLMATVTGAVGVVSPLLVLACAAERATAAQKPQLALTLGDEFLRLAMVVLPAPPPVPENAGTKAGAA